MENETALSGPHVAAAFLCEKILMERDGVASFIRVVDRFTIAGPDAEMVKPAPLQTTLAVSFKAGSAKGKHRIKIRVNKPNNGGTLAESEVPVYFEGAEEHGVLVGMPMMLVIQEEGLYWIDVRFEDALVTRIPLRVLYQQAQMANPGAGL